MEKNTQVACGMDCEANKKRGKWENGKSIVNKQQREKKEKERLASTEQLEGIEEHRRV